METQATKAQTKASLNYQTTLNRVLEQLHRGEKFSDIFPVIEKDLLILLNAERLTVYQKGAGDKEIVSKFKSGTEIKEIRLPLAPTSIAGYVAMSHNMVAIENAYDEKELLKIHPQLKFNEQYDKQTGFITGAILAVPIKVNSIIVGVMQLINRRGGGSFTAEEKLRAEKIAGFMGQKFRYEFGITRSPFDYLVQTKRIKAETLAELEKRAQIEGCTVAHLLLTEGGVTRLEVGQSLERYYQVPFQPFDPNIKIPHEVLSGINESYMLKQRWVPIGGDRNRLTVLIDDPSDANRVMEIQRTVPAKEYIFKVGFADDILKFLGQNVSTPGSDANLQELVGKLQDESEVEQEEVVETVDENAATVIQFVNRLIMDAAESRASDIHLEPGKGRANMSVRFRIDGDCRPHLSVPASHAQGIVSRIKIISGLDISERRKPQDGKCLVKLRGQPLELRVATIPTVNGESVVMRLLASSEPLPLAKMNFSPQNLAGVEAILQRPHGIFLVVGPTGSGKTTTLHSVLGHINTPDVKIWTAEDPVEITQAGMLQVQMQPKIGLTFASALRAFLRADPDVIMIGEMRDQETAHAGVEASLTGHLVFSTLHTNSAPETVVRLVDLGIDPISFSDALLGVLAQRLVRTLCAKCKAPYAMTDEEYDTIKRYYGEEAFPELGIERGKSQLYKPVGCPDCGNSGYKGRTGIHELLVATPAIKALVCHKATASELKKLALSEGMRTLMQDGIKKLVLGQTDLEQIRKVAAT